MFFDYFNSLNYLQTEDTPFLLPDYDTTYISTCEGIRVYTKKKFAIQELIGEEIAKFMNRDTIHYFLLRKNGILKLASYPFIESEQLECYPNDLKDDILFNEDSITADDRYENYIPFFLEQSQSQVAKEKFLTDLYKTFAIDTYMRQGDRCSCNCMMYQEDNNLYWTPMYDYTDSFNTFKNKKDVFDSYYYDNPFFIMNLDDYAEFLDLYPDFINYLKQIQKIDLQKILQTIQNKYAFRYSEEFSDYWKKQEELSQNLLQKIIK